MEFQQRGVPKYEQNRAVKSEDPIVEITNCATGDGNTLRRLRSSSHREVFKEFFDGNQDTCLQTPSPKRAAKPVGPPKIDRKSRRGSRSSRYSDDNSFLNMPEKEVEEILETSRQNIAHLFQDFRKYVPEDINSTQNIAAMDKARSVLGSPFRERPSALPSESPPSSDEIGFPPKIVAYDPCYKRETSSEHSDLLYSSSRHQVLVAPVERRSLVRPVNDRRVS